MVSSGTITAIYISFFLAVGVPLILLLIFKRKFNIKYKVFFSGMLTFFVFVQLLEGLAHTYFLVGNETTKNLFENPWLYMLYGGLMAGIFEEVGRFLMMKYTLNKYREWKDGLTFGLGHGFMEAILLVGINSVVMLAFSTIINNGTFDTLPMGEQSDAGLITIKDQLVNSPAYMQVLGGVERLSALALHMGLSILVMLGIRNKKTVYLLYAILIHAVFNFPAALYQKDVLENVFVVETIIAIMAVGAIVWIVKSKKLFSREEIID